MNLVEFCPVMPLHNIYFTQLLPLVDIKLRLGRAQLATQTSPSDVAPTDWQTAVKELELGLQLARSAACQRKPVEALLLSTLGRVFFQHLKTTTFASARFFNSYCHCLFDCSSNYLKSEIILPPPPSSRSLSN